MVLDLGPAEPGGGHLTIILEAPIQVTSLLDLVLD